MDSTVYIEKFDLNKIILHAISIQKKCEGYADEFQKKDFRSRTLGSLFWLIQPYTLSMQFSKTLFDENYVKNCLKTEKNAEATRLHYYSFINDTLLLSFIIHLEAYFRKIREKNPIVKKASNPNNTLKMFQSIAKEYNFDTELLNFTEMLVYQRNLIHKAGISYETKTITYKNNKYIYEKGKVPYFNINHTLGACEAIIEDIVYPISKSFGDNIIEPSEKYHFVKR